MSTLRWVLAGLAALAVCASMLHARPQADASPLGASMAAPSNPFGSLASSPVVPAAPVSPEEPILTDGSFDEGLRIFHGHIGVFVIAFLVTLFATPVCRRFAVKYGVIDRPDEARKQHKYPIAYLGGLAVFLGVLAAIVFSYAALARPEWGLITFHESAHNGATGSVPPPVPFAILAGMTVVMFVGMLDDVIKMLPMTKIGGQLIAAGLLAYSDIGTKLAQQVLSPIGTLIGNPGLRFDVGGFELDVVYWAGTGLIALLVLSACNASNLVDGLDGLLAGVTAIAGIGLLVIALALAGADNGPLDHARLVLCLAMIGACLGFLPHNFNPAVIFLGDAGSLLLGFLTIVIIMTLGDTGRTNLVLAGLVIYAVPVLDTSLAIVRRKLAGKKLSEGDSDHLHHMLKRALGVKGAALTLYGIGAGFAILGVFMTFERARVTYVFVLVLVSFIGVTAFKVARRKQFEEQAKKLAEQPARRGNGNGNGHTATQIAAANPSPTPLPASANGSLDGAPAPSSPSVPASPATPAKTAR